MPTPRFSAGRPVMSSSPKKIWPPVGFKSPLIRLSAVDLPQPEGPSRPTSLPSGISKVKSLAGFRAAGELFRQVLQYDFHVHPFLNYVIVCRGDGSAFIIIPTFYSKRSCKSTMQR